MKSKTTRFGARSKIAFAATMMTVPILASAQEPQAQETKTGASQHKKSASSQAVGTAKSSAHVKMNTVYRVVGSHHGHTVYKNDAGQLFWIDPATGDQRFLSADAKHKSAAEKISGKVTSMGVDAKGNVIKKNSRGEKFHLDPATGDMVPAK